MTYASKHSGTVLCKLAAGAVSCVFVPTLDAAWEVTPRIAVSETYTDNVTLAPPGQEEEDFVTQVNPELALIQAGPRANSDIRYRMQNLFYAEESDRNETFHQLNARTRVEAVRETVFVDADTTVTQQIVDPAQRISFDNLSVTGNRTDVITANIGPTLRHDFTDVARGQLRYRFGIVDFDEEDDAVRGSGFGAEDSRRNEVQATLSSPSVSTQRWEWAVDYRDSRFDYDSDREDKFARLILDLGYHLTRDLTLIGVAGHEDNRFERSGITDDTTGTLWEAGVRWQPQARDLLELRVGERFFGRTINFAWEHQGARTTTEVHYTENISNVAETLLDNTIVIDEVPEDLPINGLGLTSQVFVRERLDGKATFNLSRSAISLHVYSEQRDFEFGDQNDEVYGVTAGWQYRYTSRTSIHLSLTGQHNEFSADAREDDLARVRLGLRNRLSPSLQLNLDTSYTRRESDLSEQEYEENAVTLRLIKDF